MKKKKEKSFDLKVYKNKRTGQLTILLPKKKMKRIPKKVKVTW